VSKKLNSRNEKLAFLRGVLKKNRSIDELVDVTFKIFVTRLTSGITVDIDDGKEMTASEFEEMKRKFPKMQYFNIDISREDRQLERNLIALGKEK
jgi:hypothetical protein